MLEIENNITKRNTNLLFYVCMDFIIPAFMLWYVTICIIRMAKTKRNKGYFK